MSLYVRVFSNFYTHRKTARLKSVLGNDALWLPPRIWSYAAENQPDGCFEGYTPEELGMLLGYQGDAQAMLKAMLQAGFMDPDPLRIHDWHDHNGFHESFSRRASNAAKARWEKTQEPKGHDQTRHDMKGGKHCLEYACSISASDPERHSVGNPTLDEAKGYAVMIGLVEWLAIDTWEEHEAVGWKDYRGRPIVDWRPILRRVKVKWEADGRPMSKPGRKQHESNAKPNPRNVGVYQGADYGEIAQRKMERQHLERQKELDREASQARHQPPSQGAGNGD